MNNRPLCFVAGKSGGHIIPCLTLAEKKHAHSTQKILFFSSDTPLDNKILHNHPRVSHHIPLTLRSIHPTSLLDYIRIPCNIAHSFFISLYHLWKERPSEIITTGGVVALPVCYAGFLLRIPVTAYCLDAIPGKAIKALQPIASRMNVCFTTAQSHLRTAHLVDYPVNYTHDDIMQQEKAREYLELDPHKKTIVILGGSQGSLFLNDILKKWILSPSFPRNTLQIIHQTGDENAHYWQQWYQEQSIPSYIFGYQSDLNQIYCAADLIICRAGAGTLFEIQFFNKPCIVIPLRTRTTTHQVDNARAMSSQFPELFSWIDQTIVENNPTILFQAIIKKLELP